MGSISAIGANYSVQQDSAIKAAEKKTETAANEEQSASSGVSAKKQDRIELSKEGIYKSLYSTEKKLSADTVDAIKEAQNASFKNMLGQMLGNQGSVYNFSMKLGSEIGFDYSGSDKLSQLLNDNGGIDVSKLKSLMEGNRSSSSGGILDEKYMPDFSQWTTPREIAQKYLQNKADAGSGENSYWGAEAVSDRIMNMVKALSGGSSERFESLKDAVKEGFQSAKNAWGGSGLDITSKTYDATLSKLDALSEKLKASGSAEKAEEAKSDEAAEKTDSGVGAAEKIEENSGLTGDLGLTKDSEE